MPRVLVADDDVEQLTVQRALLEALGYEVCTAISPNDALRELEQNPPSLIVIDLCLPQASDGLSLIRAIRDRTQLPLIVLSGWPDDLYGSPEEQMVSRVVIKGSVKRLLETIQDLLPS
jgi:CheY-like chemotaxis protein